MLQELEVTNGMVIPNYSKPDDWEKFNALGVSQYGQMTAGKLYVHYQSTRNCAWNYDYSSGMLLEKLKKSPKGGLFVTSGLGGMSGAQQSREYCRLYHSLCQINPKKSRKSDTNKKWVDEIHENLTGGF